MNRGRPRKLTRAQVQIVRKSQAAKREARSIRRASLIVLREAITARRAALATIRSTPTLGQLADSWGVSRNNVYLAAKGLTYKEVGP